MIEAGVGVYLLGAAGALAFAAKFAFGPVPAPHHRQALAQAGLEGAPNVLTILGGVYLALAGALAGLGALLAILALGPVLDGEWWAGPAATGAALLAAVPTTYGAWRTEKRTGVRTPYRASMVLGLLAVLALVLVSL